MHATDKVESAAIQTSFRQRIVPLCCACAVVVSAIGCGPEWTRIELTTYDAAGGVQKLYAQFDRVYYHRPASGLVEVALISEEPSQRDPAQTITHLVHIQELWHPHPGVTFAEPTQINVRVRYAILTPPTGVRYDGSGFFTYKIKDGGLVGELESGQLQARYRMGDIVERFPHARFTGTVIGVPHSGEVVALAQRLDTLFRHDATERRPSSSGSRR